MITAIPVVKPTITGCGMNLMTDPNLSSHMVYQDDAGDECRGHQAVDTILLDDPLNDYHKRAGRPTDQGKLCALVKDWND